MGLFDRLMGRDLPERRDGRRIYFRLLEQSRDPGFFGAGRFADDYDGRIDMIALHLSIMMERMRSEGQDGILLNQALFDEMKDDFEVALREEGISDTGVKKRIKPMIGHFYDRLKSYTEALQADNREAAMTDALVMQDGDDRSEAFRQSVSTYSATWLDYLKTLSFKEITAARFTFPDH